MELVEQLKQQAGIQDNPDQEGLNLFAELVIEECLKVVDDFDTESLLVNSIVDHFRLR